MEKGANVILCSHFGRPKGEIIEKGKNGRLTPVVPHLEKLLGVQGMFSMNIINLFLYLKKHSPEIYFTQVAELLVICSDQGK